jgi:hypothetical protein
MAFKTECNPTFPAKLTLVSAGEEQVLNVTFRHMGRKAFQGVVEGLIDVKEPSKAEAEAVLKLVKEWDADCALTQAAVEHLCDERPGFAMALIQGYQKAFLTALKGN